MRVERLICLDGLRGVAAVIVVVHHALTLLGLPNFPTMLAVDLFFMISGFVIPYAYEAKLHSGLGVWSFARIRIVRLYPLYILGVAITLGTFAVLALRYGLWHLREPFAWLVPWAILLLPRPVPEPEHSFLLNPPAWSLFLEIVVNLLYVVLLPWLTKRVLVAIIAASATLLAVASVIFGTLNFGTGGYEMAWGMVRITCPFAIGVLIFRLWQDGALPRGPVSPLWAPALFLLTLLPPPGLLSWLLDVLVLPVIVWAAVASVPVGASARILAWLGDLSYPLYAVHMPILFATTTFGAMLGVPSVPGICAGLTLAVVGGHLAGRFYDPWARAQLARLFNIRSRDVDAARAL